MGRKRHRKPHSQCPVHPVPLQPATRHRGQVKKSCRRQKGQLEADVEQQQGRYAHHHKSRQKQDAPGIPLAIQRHRQKGQSPHHSRADHGRHTPCQHSIDNDDPQNRSSRDSLWQAQHRTQPDHDRRHQTDMRAGYRQQMHDTGDRECLQEFRLQTGITAKQHGKDCCGILGWHHRLHGKPIVLPNRCQPTPEAFSLSSLCPYAPFAR